MKHLNRFLFLSCLLCLLTVGVYAQESKTFTFEDIGISIDMPADHCTVTRETPPDDPVFDLVPSTPEQFQEYPDTILRSYPSEWEYGIALSVFDTENEDFNHLSSEKLSSLVPILIPDDCKEISSGIYAHAQTPFIMRKYEPTGDGTGTYGLDYLTIFNGKFITVSFYPHVNFEGFPSDIDALMKDIVESLTFHDSFLRSIPVTVYALDDIGMVVSIPADHIVFTTDIDENDPNLEKYNRTKTQMQLLMSSGNNQLYLWDSEMNYDISISCEKDSTDIDYNDVSDEMILDFAATSLKEIYDSGNCELLTYEVYHHEQVKFLKTTYRPLFTDSYTYSTIYTTYYKGDSYSISLTSFRDVPEAADEAVLQQIVDSIQFIDSANKPVSSEGSDPSASEEIVSNDNIKTITPIVLIVCIVCLLGIVAIVWYSIKKRRNKEQQ